MGSIVEVCTCWILVRVFKCCVTYVCYVSCVSKYFSRPSLSTVGSLLGYQGVIVNQGSNKRQGFLMNIKRTFS